MEYFWQYLKQHKKVIAVFLLFVLIFGVTFALYQLPLSAVLYSAGLCACLGIGIMLFDFKNFVEKHRALKHLMQEILVNCEHLPVPAGLLETDYQEMVRLLFEAKKDLNDEMNHRYTGLVEYYTIWAHQIKTPIASMRLNLQNEDTPFSREIGDDLMRIEQYVEMVLMVLRLDSSSTDYVLAEYELDGIVRQAVKRFASQFIRRKLKLVYQPLHCKVLTDEKWLLFVIEQVLSNALKYTKTGSVTIEVESPKTLCIRDTGIGIAPEDLPRVFEQGYTGYNGRSDKKASGIGLYLCRRICENLGHRIWATSSVGEGTVIHINLNSAQLQVE